MHEGPASNVVPLGEAARRSGLSARRLRQLAAEARIPARKIGNRWVIDPDELASALRANGRPLSDLNVWGLLFLMSNEPAPWLDAVNRSRLRPRASLRNLPKEAARLARRAHPHYFRNDSERLELILDRSGFVPSGARVASEHGASVSSEVIEGYLPESSVTKVAYEAALRPANRSSANVVLHGVEGFWPLAKRREVPIAVALLDLLESGDERSERAARSYVRS